MTTKNLHITSKNIHADIQLPASKSISNRALIINALAYSPYNMDNLSDCDDTDVMLAVLDSNDTHFNIGAAGTSMRFLTAFLAKTVGEWTITGSQRMQERPIKILVDALNKLGAKITYMKKEGFPPLKIYGSALLGGEITMNGSISSQYISALMMIAPYMRDGLIIHLEGDIISKPYIKMTAKIMKDFGVQVAFDGNSISIKPQTYIPKQYKIESDWSAASYWYEVLAIAKQGEIRLKGLQKDSYQGDSKVADLFQSLGVQTTYLEDGIKIYATESTNKKFEYDFINQPDLAQTFAVTCCLKDIPFYFKGVQSLKIKETNRIAALMNELKKLGYIIHEPQEGHLAWDGQKTNIDDKRSPSIRTYDDHRMAMAFAPAALKHPIIIENPQVVTKSYPNFWEEFGKLFKI